MITSVLQHEGHRAAYEDAQKQIGEIHERIGMKTSGLKDIQVRLEKQKLRSSDARKLEQVNFNEFLFSSVKYFLYL